MAFYLATIVEYSERGGISRGRVYCETIAAENEFDAWEAARTICQDRIEEIVQKEDPDKVMVNPTNIGNVLDYFPQNQQHSPPSA